MDLFRRRPSKEAERFSELLDAVLSDGHDALLQADRDETLGPLVRLSRRTRDALRVSPAPLARQEARRAMLNHAAARATNSTAPLQLPGFATAAAVSAAVLLTGVFGTVSAAEAALPGDALYPVKTGLEETLLILTPSEAARLQLRIDFAQRRTAELEALHAREREVPPAFLERVAEQTAQVVLAAQALPPDPARASQLGDLVTRQQQVLTELRTKVPPTAQPAIEHAIEVTQHGQQVASDHRASSGSSPAQNGAPNSGRRGAGEGARADAPASAPAPVSLVPPPAAPERRRAESGGGNRGRGNQEARPDIARTTVTPVPGAAAAPTVRPSVDVADDRPRDRGRADDRPVTVPGNRGPGGSGPGGDPPAGAPDRGQRDGQDRPRSPAGPVPPAPPPAGGPQRPDTSDTVAPQPSGPGGPSPAQTPPAPLPPAATPTVPVPTPQPGDGPQRGGRDPGPRQEQPRPGTPGQSGGSGPPAGQREDNPRTGEVPPSGPDGAPDRASTGGGQRDAEVPGAGRQGPPVTSPANPNQDRGDRGPGRGDDRRNDNPGGDDHNDDRNAGASPGRGRR